VNGPRGGTHRIANKSMTSREPAGRVEKFISPDRLVVVRNQKGNLFQAIAFGLLVDRLEDVTWLECGEFRKLFDRALASDR